MYRFRYLFTICNKRTSLLLSLPMVYSLDHKSRQNRYVWSQLSLRTARLQIKTIDTIHGDLMKAFVKVARYSVNAWDIEECMGDGSGFIVDNSGLVISNCHVSEDDDYVGLYLYVKDNAGVETCYEPGDLCHGRVVYVEPHNDLSFIRICVNSQTYDPLVNTPITFADSEPIVGQRIMSVGNPPDIDSSVCDGVVSTLDRKGCDFSNGFYQYYYLLSNPENKNVIHASDVFFGFSGSPVADMTGKVIAVHYGGYDECTKIATSAQVAKEFIIRGKQFERDDRLKRYQFNDQKVLAIGVLEFTDEIRNSFEEQVAQTQFGDHTTGVIVWNLLKPSTYEDEINRFDLIRRVDEIEVNSVQDFKNAIKGKNEMTLSVVRDGVDHQIVITRDVISCSFV